MTSRYEGAAPVPAGQDDAQRIAGRRGKKARLPFIRFHQSELPMDALRRAWATRIDFLRKHHGNGLLESDKEVHLLRLTAKRFRAYLQFVRPVVDDDSYRAENRCLREASRSLAGSRDQTVALRTLAQLEKKSEGKRARKALEKTRRAIEESRAGHEEIESAAVTVERSGAAIAALEESFQRFGLIDPRAAGWPVMAGGLRHTYRRARNRFRRWKKTSDPAEAHACRRYAKYLMFQIELLEEMNPGKVQTLRAECKELEKQLGKLNDLVTLGAKLDHECAAGRLSPAARKTVRRLEKRSAKDLRKAGRKTGRKLFRRPAGRLVKGLETDWRRWRDGGAMKTP